MGRSVIPSQRKGGTTIFPDPSDNSPIAQFCFSSGTVDIRSLAERRSAGESLADATCFERHEPSEITHLSSHFVSKPVALEFIAKTTPQASKATLLSVYMNRKVVLANDLEVGVRPAMFHLDCPTVDLVWNVTFLRRCVVTGDVVNDPIQLDRDFGMQVNGEDILPLIRVESKEGQWVKRGRQMLPVHYSARDGQLEGVRFHCEKVLEFVVGSLTGSEEFDIYVNGLSTPCQKGVRPGVAPQPQLIRVQFAPITCEIRSVVIHLRRRETGALTFDPAFGVMMNGQDMLPSVMFVSEEGVQNPHGWKSRSSEWRDLKGGHWSWQGYYHMLAYRATKRVRERSAPAAREGLDEHLPKT